jgi:hypothetical protein
MKAEVAATTNPRIAKFLRYICTTSAQLTGIMVMNFTLEGNRYETWHYLPQNLARFVEE